MGATPILFSTNQPRASAASSKPSRRTASSSSAAPIPGSPKSPGRANSPSSSASKTRSSPPTTPIAAPICLEGGKLVPMPDGMRMMVPTILTRSQTSPLFSESARQVYREEPSRAEELKAFAASPIRRLGRVRRELRQSAISAMRLPKRSPVRYSPASSAETFGKLSANAVMAPTSSRWNANTAA